MSDFRNRIFGVTAFVLLAPAVALAYIPPSRFIVKTMAAKRTGLKSVRIVSEVFGYDSSGKPNGDKFKAITFYFPATKIMKSEAYDASGQALFGIEKRGQDIPLDLMVLYDPNSWELIAALKRANIPVTESEPQAPQPLASGVPASPSPQISYPPEQTYLHRWNATVAWVLGDRPGKDHEQPSQLWIQKDTFLPVRILIADQDVQFTKYRYSQDLPYPRSVSIATRSGTLAIEENTLEVKANFPAKYGLKTISDGFTDAGNSSSLKELIRKYYAGLR